MLEAWASGALSAPATEEEEEEEEPGSDFLLASIMEEDRGLSWRKGDKCETTVLTVRGFALEMLRCLKCERFE